jgi:hypothetical protein
MVSSFITMIYLMYSLYTKGRIILFIGYQKNDLIPWHPPKITIFFLG